jgi:hypothetical protein
MAPRSRRLASRALDALAGLVATRLRTELEEQLAHIKVLLGSRLTWSASSFAPAIRREHSGGPQKVAFRSGHDIVRAPPQ